ncbi:LacI family DNA-binding transcriptional regulator [Salinibacterium sp. PAMC 21357]|uniref:LacI family DNA-binding transcriptional regulator n=1 Tax=Salinibacterium sp. PAMC 21357 TaxID=1112215 RepID=UPI00028A3975|nr:LacI family DNA-binding transcriptional regulator [Salinibacterium sp. PAMC 21357]
MESTKAQRPTLNDVAQHAGVSIATASKALNGRSDVAASTRARIEAAIEATGYGAGRPRGAAAAPTIEFLVDKLTSPYAMEILRGVTLAAEEAGIDVVVGRFRPSPHKSDQDVIRRLNRSGRVGAIILTVDMSEATHQAISRSAFPIVLIDPLRMDESSVASVGSTNWIGGRSATEHLIGLGHRNIAIIGGPAESLSARARVDGFRSAADAAGLTIPGDFITHTSFDHDAAELIAHELLSRTDRPTAIVASSDAQAMGVLEAARQLDIRVPEHLSLVGYDDTYVASWANPPLTCVYQPLQDIGRVALRTVQQLSAGEHLDSHHIELATRLVVRESTAPPSDRNHS